MKIRKATLKDAKMILELFNSDKNLWGTNIKCEMYNFGEIKYYIKDKNSFVVVCETDNKIVGAFFAESWKDYIHLDDIVVDKKHRHHGIGRQMLGYLENLAKRERGNLIELITNVNNKKMQKLLRKNKYRRGKKFFFYFKELK